MTQEELQKLLDDFTKSKIAQTPQWKIDNADRFREIQKDGCKLGGNKQSIKCNLDGHRNSSLGGKSNTSAEQAKKNSLRKYNGHPPTTSILVFKDNEFIKEYKSISECARDMNLYKGNIGKVLKGKFKQHKGYFFKYKE